MVEAPGAVVISAPASGHGKTTVATGLMAALTARGRDVAPFKVGPDFIDPGFHALATGRPGRNLDPNLQTAPRVAPLYSYGARGADLAVVEGVMGLFDGRIGVPAPDGVSGFGSTAHVAALLGAPVVLVVDARGHSQSLAALVRGYATFAPGTHIAGVVLNQVGSDRHTEILTDACASVGVPVLGAVPRAAELGVPSRHLGLVTTDALESPAAAVAAMGETMAAHLDLEAIASLATSSVGGDAWDPAVASVPEGTRPPRIAVASGPAFGFRYPEWEEMLAASGAEPVLFDPRADPFPAGADGVLLLGGYPEVHAAELAANEGTRARIRAALAGGMPAYAECGGLAYLGRRLDAHEMCGSLDLDVAFGSRLVLGYREAVALADTAFTRAGERYVGHEFHRTAVVGEGPSTPAVWGWRAHDGHPTTEGRASGRTHASYLHLHPAGAPQLVARLVAEASNPRMVG